MDAEPPGNSGSKIPQPPPSPSEKIDALISANYPAHLVREIHADSPNNGMKLGRAANLISFSDPQKSIALWREIAELVTQNRTFLTPPLINALTTACAHPDMRVKFPMQKLRAQILNHT